MHNRAQRARDLRKNMTDAEMVLWQHIRKRQINVCRFRRQFLIGSYIVDFVCLEKRLIIEVDGGQHADSVYDDSRTAWLEDQGFKVIRFWNNDVLKEMDAVLEVIRMALSPPP
jgi:very-short-patch-repair endonuclease